MEKNLDDIMNSINAKLNDKNRNQNLQNAIKQEPFQQSTEKNPIISEPFRPSHNMIVSDIYLIAPTQLKLISEMLAKKIANDMNMRGLYPRIQDILNKALPETLSLMKKSGKK